MHTVSESSLALIGHASVRHLEIEEEIDPEAFSITRLEGSRWRLRRTRASRNSPSLAVALNWGIGSSSLKADVKAFDRLQIVRDRNSSYFGLK